jgi:hypothetical protein
MNAIQASLQRILIESLETILAPIVKLTLYCGLGHSEFAAAVRRVFIEVASQEYGVRGRPANIAKISAKTGIPRKTIGRYRGQRHESDWTPDDEISPLNTIIHYWRFGEEYSHKPGLPRELPYEGDGSFSALVKSCVGDIPVSTIRQQLIREGIATQHENGFISLSRDYSFPERIDEDFLRYAAFALKHHAQTLCHNAMLVGSGKGTTRDHINEGRFERVAWSRRVDKKAASALQMWVREYGSEVIEKADERISRLEVGPAEDDSTIVAGLGVYFFRDH